MVKSLTFNEPGRLNNRQAAQFLGVHPATLANWRCYGRGPPYGIYKVGRIRFVYYDRKDLEVFKKQRGDK